MNRTHSSNILLLLLSVNVLLLPHCSRAPIEYNEEVVFTIPWGEESGGLSTAFTNPEFNYPPTCPWAVHDDRIFVIAEITSQSYHLVSYNTEGTRQSSLNLGEQGLPFPADMAFSSSGLLAFGYGSELYILDSDLRVQQSSFIPQTDVFVMDVYPGNNSSWWITYTYWYQVEVGVAARDYVVELHEDGSLGEAILIYDSEAGTGEQAFSVSPDGDPHARITDKYGYKYLIIRIDPGKSLMKYTPSGQQVYSCHVESDTSWSAFDSLVRLNQFLITWSGDFYTIHATAEGAVVTKFTLE